MNRTLNTIAVIIVGIAMILQSCIKDDFQFSELSRSQEIQPNIASPLGFMSLNLDKILRDNGVPKELIIGRDSFLTLKYSKQIFSLAASDVIYFPDMTDTVASLNLTGEQIDLVGVEYPFSIPQQRTYIEFGFNKERGERLDSVKLESITLGFNTAGNISVDGTMRLSFPTLTKNGVPYSKVVVLNTNNSAETLLGYTLSLINDTEHQNAIPVDINITLTAGFSIVPNNDEVAYTIVSLENVQYETIFGNVGQQYIDIDRGEIKLDIYDDIPDGVFHFENPQLNIYFSNSIGVPLSVIMTGFSMESREGENIEIIGSAVPTISSPLTIRYPDYSQIGQSVEDSLKLNNSNTNLFTVLETAPVKLRYSVEGETGYNPGQINFIHKNSAYDVKADLILPLSGYAGMLLMLDTLDFKLSDFYTDIEEIKEVTFRLYTKNSFPAQVETQLYFADADMNILDSLYLTPQLLGGGLDTNGDGISELTENETIVATIDRAKVEKIMDTAHLILQGDISTVNFESKQNVKIYSFYELFAQLGVVVSVDTNAANY